MNNYLHCRYDYLTISDENNVTVGKYCGNHTGRKVLVGGDHAFLKFYSDYAEQTKGFVMIFTPVNPSKYLVEVFDTIK